MRNALAPLLFCAGWLVAGPSLAQPPAKAAAPSTTVAPVTVQAAPSPAMVQKEARDFVLSVAAPSPAIDQIARWHTPICISVAGLAPDQAKRVSSRIQEVADGLGLHTLPSGCQANIEIVFTDKPQAFMDTVAATREELLGYYHRHQKAALKTVTRPVQAWYTTATDSGAIANNAGLAFAAIVTHGGASTGVTIKFQPQADVSDDPDNPVPTGCSDAPQFTHCLESKLSNVLIVVDPGRLKDETLGPMTDYLSMLALTQMRSLDGCAVLPSVIDRLGKPCGDRQAPDGLTPADAAYLSSLYTSDLDMNKPLEQDEISRRMADILVKASAPAK